MKFEIKKTNRRQLKRRFDPWRVNGDRRTRRRTRSGKTLSRRGGSELKAACWRCSSNKGSRYASRVSHFYFTVLQIKSQLYLSLPSLESITRRIYHSFYDTCRFAFFNCESYKLNWRNGSETEIISLDSPRSEQRYKNKSKKNKRRERERKICAQMQRRIHIVIATNVRLISAYPARARVHKDCHIN